MGARKTPLRVWGPQGTRHMMEHLPQAFAVDIRVRSRNYPPDGVKLQAEEIKEGVVYADNGVAVSAFEVIMAARSCRPSVIVSILSAARLCFPGIRPSIEI